MNWLKEATQVTVAFGPFVDSSDGDTAMGSLTIQKADVRLSKNGGSFAAAHADQGASNAGAAYLENGYYAITLDTTDTNGANLLLVAIKKTGALPVWKEFMIVPSNAYAALIEGVEYLEVTALAPYFSISGDQLTVKKPDGSTDQYTRTITSSAGAPPVTGLSAGA